MHLLFHLRGGFRVPLHSLAISAGAALGLEQIDYVDGPSPGVVAWWAAIDVHPTCAWAIPFTATLSDPSGGSMLAFQLGIAFQPNHRCEREASTVHGL
jgi:hypothetical protein